MEFDTARVRVRKFLPKAMINSAPSYNKLVSENLIIINNTKFKIL
jgi:hypothetical protein